MKKLITIEGVQQIKKDGGGIVCIDSNTLITPGAKDLASELGMEIKYGKKDDKPAVSAVSAVPSVSDDIVNRIVNEVIKAVAAANVTVPRIVKECDQSGIRLIRGGSVTLDRFDTGVASDKVGIKEILSTKECPNLATGFMEIEKSSFDWTLGYDELDYIVEGDMDITVDGKTYRGHAGDVFFIPMNTSITFGSPNYCKFFFTAYPSNWQELSGKK